MASDYWQVPIDHLRGLKGTLESIEASVSSPEPNAKNIDGVDTEHGHEMVQAVNNFYRDWKQSRKTLLKNLETIAEATGTIADSVEEYDSQVAQQLDQMAGQLSSGGEG